MARGRKLAQPIAAPSQGRRVELWRVATVEAFTGLKRRTLQGMADRGDFPKARALGKKTIAWIAAEVEEWALNRPVA